MPHFRATRDFLLGGARQTLREGDVVECFENQVTINNKTFKVAGLEGIIAAGLLESLTPPEVSSELVPATTMSPVRAQSLPPPPKEEVKLVPAHKNPDKPHVWEDDFLGNGAATCKVCGVTRSGGKGWGNIRADKKSMPYQYTDAYGETMQSLNELPCPLFIGDTNGAVAGNIHRVRKLKGQVEGIDERVETIDERLARLEHENDLLREQSARRQEVALRLLERIALAAEQIPAENVRQLLLPDHGEIFDVLAIEVPGGTPERVLLQEGGSEEDLA